MSPLRRLALVAAALLVAGCQSTPTAPPALDLPPATLARVPVDLDRWWVAFDDPALTRLVDEALANNLDIAAAVARVELARSNVLLAQSYLYPSANLQAGTIRSRISTLGSPPLPSEVDPLSNNYRLGVQASYELDVWGKYRTSTQAARQTLLASEYSRETVRTAVAAEVARAYFSLLAAEAELALLRDTMKSRDESVALQRDRYEAGIVGELDLRQAEAERAALLANHRHRGARGRPARVGAGDAGRPDPARGVRAGRGAHRGAQRLLAVPSIPEGLPSGLLERRPDVRRVEAELAAASLRMDVARADYFPSISLTGCFGSESAALGTLFTGPGAAWNLGASLLQPMIGSRPSRPTSRRSPRYRARRSSPIGRRCRTRSARRHDALVVNRTARAALAPSRSGAASSKRARAGGPSLRAGYTSYLEVLDAQRQLVRRRR